MKGVSATAIAVKALRDATGGMRVSTQLPQPEKRPDEFIIISRIGGGSDDWATKNPRFLVECYALNEADAERVADGAWEAWQKLRTPPVHYATVDNNLTRYDNPDLKHHRFQFTAGLQLRR